MKAHKLPKLSIEQTAELIPPRTILAGYRGSRSHNTYIPSTEPGSIDDIDIMCVFVPELTYYIGVKEFNKRQRGTKEKMLDAGHVIWDSVAYEVRKYVHLLLKSNPNVLSLLYLRENLYIHVGEVGQRLIDNRELFVSKKAFHSFSGYADSQLKRMENHACEGIMGAKRKALVKKHGYDTKNAAHLIRLLRMGIEFLTDGELQVHRYDANEIKSIKRGEWSLEKVKTESAKLFELSREAYVRSSLPAEPDYEKANLLTINIIQDVLKGAL